MYLQSCWMMDEHPVLSKLSVVALSNTDLMYGASLFTYHLQPVVADSYSALKTGLCEFSTQRGRLHKTCDHSP